MPATRIENVLDALKTFARQVKNDAELGTRIKAGPEDQLKVSVRELVIRVGATLNRHVSILSESPVEDVGRPDLAIAVDGLLVGYIELKAPGEGTTDREFKGRNREQLRKFRALPNLIYTDANDWTFYQKGDTDEKNTRRKSLDVRLGDLTELGDSELTEDDASDLLAILREFLKWQPIVPTNARALAMQLAPLTRILRDNVAERAQVEGSALASVYADWQRTLFPEATPAEFADSYAQTFTYGLLLAKLSGATTLDTDDAAAAIAHHSSLLSRTLQMLTLPGTRDELGVGIELLERTIDAIDPSAIRGKGDGDPWLYFYEDFLAVYDPKLRNERGVYYTPAQVVKAQVTLVDELLKTKLNRPDGVADGDVTVLDPATGTGTYLLSVLQHGVDHASLRYGPGAAGNIASQMARNLYGFELLVGPYAVAHLRMTQQIHELGGREPEDGVHIYLTDTLESPHETTALPHSFFEEPLAEEHRRAREVKAKTKILVCIGNPPYEREEGDPSIPEQDRDTGSWIRSGDQQTSPPLETFLKPAREAGAGKYLRNLYNSYVYFWRWALWKVFETQSGPGIVSFITASSYLRGPSFVGMREEMRRTFDELWVLDLEGNIRGTRKTENVFDIQTPVAIAIGVRYGKAKREAQAKVHYARLIGNREEKFALLDGLNQLDNLAWESVHEGWQKPFMPSSEGDYFVWPLISSMLPWQHPGLQYQRSWPIGETQQILQARWEKLLASEKRAELFRESSDRKIHKSYPNLTGGGELLASIGTMKAESPMLEAARIGFRTFDPQWAILDPRLADRIRPQLWSTRSDSQLYMSSLFEIPLDAGPAIAFSPYVPERHSFRGSYSGKDILPLFRDAAAKEPNITFGLLDLLGTTYGDQVSPEDLISYIAGVLGHPGYTERFHDELEVPGPRVPLTKDAGLFRRAVDLGKQVIAWQTYAERFPEAIGTTQGHVPDGSARLLTAIPYDADKYPQNLRDVRYDGITQELHVGEGVIGKVDPRIWGYEVSGLRVVRSWLGYRMKERSGRKSSPLDDIRPEHWTWEMTKELLALLRVLEGVIALEPAQDALLGEIVAGDLFLTEELPVPTEPERKARKAVRQPRLL